MSELIRYDFVRDCGFCEDDNGVWIRYEAVEKYITPKHETVEEWENRTGDSYPDDGPVYAKLKEGNDWGLATYDWTTIFKDNAMDVIVANHHGKPEIGE